MGKVVGLQKELSMDEQVQMMVEAREKARRCHRPTNPHRLTAL
jgi:hypothetical protein